MNPDVDNQACKVLFKFVICSLLRKIIALLTKHGRPIQVLSLAININIDKITKKRKQIL